MYPNFERFLIRQSKMAKRFSSYHYGSGVIFKTKGIWLTPVSACFFRVIAYPKRRFIIELVKELPNIPYYENRPQIAIEQLNREHSKGEAIALCQQYYKALLDYQRNNVQYHQEDRKPWLGELVYHTGKIYLSAQSAFGPYLSWCVTKLSDFQYNTYLLSFNEKIAVYDWIEFTGHFEAKDDAINFAENAYYEVADAFSDELDNINIHF